MENIRGYIFSRPFMGERVPQSVQSLLIRDYCNKNNCGRGDGDCDFNYTSRDIINGCPYGYVCENDNFLTYHPGLKNCSEENDVNDAEVCIDGNKYVLYIIHACKKSFFNFYSYFI